MSGVGPTAPDAPGAAGGTVGALTQGATATTAPAGDSTPATRPCKHCGIDVPQPKRRGQVKDFCTDRHRAAYRDNLVQEAHLNAEAVLGEVRAFMEGWLPKMQTALDELAKFRRKTRRKPAEEKK
jgi:hypothetical protein